MVMKETVAAAHDEIIGLLEETQKSGAPVSPGYIKVLLILEKLTNLNPSADAHPVLEQAQTAAHPVIHVPVPAGDHNLEVTALQPAPAKCPPHSNINQYGVCRDCQTCLHQSLNNDGVCRQCGETPAPAEGTDASF